MEDFENKILKKEKELEQIVNKEKTLIIVKGKMLSGKTTLVLSFIYKPKTELFSPQFLPLFRYNRRYALRIFWLPQVFKRGE